MHHRSLRCGSVFLVVWAAGCGGGDFVSGKGGKGGTSGAHAGRDASSGAVTGSGGADSGGAGGRLSSSGGRSGSGGSATSGGSSSDGGRQGTTDAGAGGADAAGGATMGAGGAATDAGGGGTTGTGGKLATGGTSSGGAGGTSSGGAGGSPDCTNPTTWYLDEDQDGYGSTATPPILSCVPPPGHFAKLGKDCNDSNELVHPQTTPAEVQYFEKPYQTPGGVDSYDYDCSGHEEGDPSQQKAAATCPAASLGTCGGSGYLAVSTGNRVAANGYCGSRSFRTCMNVTAFCTAQDVTNYSVAYRCR